MRKGKQLTHDARAEAERQERRQAPAEHPGKAAAPPE